MKRNDCKEFLQFVPIDFIKGPMRMYNELCSKEKFLNEIPESMFLPVGMNYNTTATAVVMNRYLSHITTLYFHQPEGVSSLKAIPTGLERLIVETTYSNPKPGKWSDLLHLTGLRVLRLGYHIKLKNYLNLKTLENLR
jgi:hypothetical protein